MVVFTLSERREELGREQIDNTMCVVFEGILEEDVVGFGRMGVCKFWMGEAVWACALWRESGGGKLGLANDAGGVR